VEVAESALVETSFSFHLFRSELPQAGVIGHAASVYLGTMFDVGPHGRVVLGDYALLNGVRVICDSSVEIGDYALISWGVVLMDTYRVPFDRDARRDVLRNVAAHRPRGIRGGGPWPARPIRIGKNVWIGADACVLPGVTIGEGSVVGTRSVVTQDVPPYTIAAGNPARIVRRLEPGETGEAA
jgi:acetyltransferase-like isoleucine patch superfamily enzyme